MLNLLLDIPNLQKVVAKKNEVYGFSSRVYFKIIPGSGDDVQVLKNLTATSPFFRRVHVKVLAHAAVPVDVFSHCRGWREISVKPPEELLVCGKSHTVKVLGQRARAPAEITLIRECATLLKADNIKLLFLSRGKDSMLLAECRGCEESVFLVFAGDDNADQ